MYSLIRNCHITHTPEVIPVYRRAGLLVVNEHPRALPPSAPTPSRAHTKMQVSHYCGSVLASSAGNSVFPLTGFLCNSFNGLGTKHVQNRKPATCKSDACSGIFSTCSNIFKYGLPSGYVTGTYYRRSRGWIPISAIS